MPNIIDSNWKMRRSIRIDALERSAQVLATSMLRNSRMVRRNDLLKERVSCCDYSNVFKL